MTRVQQVIARIRALGMRFEEAFGRPTDGVRAFNGEPKGYVTDSEFKTIRLLIGPRGPLVEADSDVDRTDRAAKYLGKA